MWFVLKKLNGFLPLHLNSMIFIYKFLIICLNFATSYFVFSFEYSSIALNIEILMFQPIILFNNKLKEEAFF